jgi:hypothetical protein
MPLPDLTNPAAATNITTFGGDDPAASIDYNVPLPGAQVINRITPIVFEGDPFQPEAQRAGTSLLQLGIVEGDEGALQAINVERLAAFYRRVLPATARPALRSVADVGGDVAPLLASSDGSPQPLIAGGPLGDQEAINNRRHLVTEEDVDLQRRRKDSYIQRLAEVQAVTLPPRAVNAAPPMITMAVAGPGNSIQEIQVDPVAPPIPRLALVETWELRSYLGDYGLGRTLQTFSLLPGERTTITVETWRSDSSTREDATSIFDSSDTAAQTRFASSLARETGSAFQDQGGWSLSVGTSASAKMNLFGWVDASATVEAGFAANHQEASQRWSNSVSQSASEHAAQVNNSRQQAVQSTSSTTTQSGSATTTVREIVNTNLRRVLNFVFRELNQTYETYIVLRDIRLAFYNGRSGSAEIVPLADLRGFLSRHIATPARQAEVARIILSMCAQRLNWQGDPVATLQYGTRPDGANYQWVDATLGADGTLNAPANPLSTDYRWRFKPGALSGAGAPRVADGLITQRSDVVIRTDNMVVEALLGQADALDPYASALQALDLTARQADIHHREQENEKIEDALQIVGGIPGNDDKVEAYERMLGEKPDIEVVPVAAVTNGRPPNQ